MKKTKMSLGFIHQQQHLALKLKVKNILINEKVMFIFEHRFLENGMK